MALTLFSGRSLIMTRETGKMFHEITNISEKIFLLVFLLRLSGFAVAFFPIGVDFFESGKESGFFILR